MKANLLKQRGFRDIGGISAIADAALGGVD